MKLPPSVAPRIVKAGKDCQLWLRWSCLQQELPITPGYIQSPKLREQSLILDKHGAQTQFLHAVLRPLHEHSLTRIPTKTKIPNRPQAQKHFPAFGTG